MSNLPLLKGSYLSPVFIRNARVVCQVRGVVKIVGVSKAPLPWPIGELNGKRELVVYKALATALKTEPAEAVAAWWGVSEAKVRKWRNAVQDGPPKERRTNQLPGQFKGS